MLSSRAVALGDPHTDRHRYFVTVIMKAYLADLFTNPLGNFHVEKVIFPCTHPNE